MSYTREWKARFLIRLEQTKSPRKAARLADVPWSTVTSAKRRDKSFSRAWQAAIDAPTPSDEADTRTVKLTIPRDVARILLEQLNEDEPWTNT